MWSVDKVSGFQDPAKPVQKRPSLATSSGFPKQPRSSIPKDDRKAGTGPDAPYPKPMAQALRLI